MTHVLNREKDRERFETNRHGGREGRPCEDRGRLELILLQAKECQECHKAPFLVLL